jgi:hypothetical protein
MTNVWAIAPNNIRARRVVGSIVPVVVGVVVISRHAVVVPVGTAVIFNGDVFVVVV